MPHSPAADAPETADRSSVLPGAAPAAPHRPFVSPSESPPELTWPAVILGALLGIVFGASSVYLVLKVGMTVSASIPIAVLSITLFRLFTRIPFLRMFMQRDATILENNIVQTTGSAGESIAFGIGVTMPALMILGFEMELTRVMLVAIFGGLLGILMMIPLRRAFIVKQHGKLVYPEGTACADVLIVGEKGGTSAATVFGGFGFGFLFWFAANGMKLFKEVPEKALSFFKGAFVSCEVNPALVGVGYIIGTRISCIMAAGGILAAWVLTPAIVFFGESLAAPLYPSEGKLIRDMDASDIRSSYVLYIAAGAVAAGGIISMLRALPLIVTSLRAGLGDMSARAGKAVSGALRTDRDLPLSVVVVGSAALVAGIHFTPAFHMNWIGALCIVVFGFLFVTVSSRLTGEIGSSSNPISGMTVATLLMTCLIFLSLGWTSDFYKITALSIAGIVCIAASNGGTTSQDLKTGFLVGATPRSQQLAILVGALTSALVIGSTLLMLNDAKTVYSRKDLPSVRLPLAGNEPRQHVKGHYGREDNAEYAAVHVRETDHIEGVRPGKYLVDESGAPKYFVDPGINGKLKTEDDGTLVERYAAPKAALMAFLIDGILSQKMPWVLILIGVSIAVVLELSGIASLPFAVGVYLPLSASTPILLGGIVRWVADRISRRRESESDTSPGTLLSAGLIAGGTIAGIVAAYLQAWDVPIAIGAAKKDAPHTLMNALSESDAFALVPLGLMTLVLLVVAVRRAANGRAAAA